MLMELGNTFHSFTFYIPKCANEWKGFTKLKMAMAGSPGARGPGPLGVPGSPEGSHTTSK